MIKKTVTYTDFNGVERTEDFYFNLSKAELMEMELTTDGGYSAMLERITNAKDFKSLVEVFKSLLLKSYGVKSDDGRRFIKSPEISSEFEQSPVYSDLFMELSTDSDAAATFIKGLIPADLAKDVEKAVKNNPQLMPVE